ncbi:hypothetical protein [Scleromatobacter humisilvae]|uniref:DUF4168 domain-containing protein n=1 Tax=Scleromatobacter humisilvae TaxID=2897159 RepID=A0A9X1YJ83_9BURK|nr:hypothetical protein [Scleromatobacter humisilvae]MCK9686712.1 hypothetical protein [Scleromatobacter humisilvae]
MPLTSTEIIMSQSFSIRPLLRYFAVVAFSILSYAAMAQAAPTSDACGHALSSFQQRLYGHFLAGPASLREFVFNERGVHLLDIREVDAWARNIQAQVCPVGEPVVSAADTGAVRLSPDISAPGAALSVTDGASRDRCSTNVLDVMHCEARSERAREAVVAELRNAQASGQFDRVGELSDAQLSSVVAPRASIATTRAAVRQELALARSAHQLEFGER